MNDQVNQDTSLAAGLAAATAPIPTLAIDLSRVAFINQLAGNNFNGGWSAIDKQLGVIASEFAEMGESVLFRNYKTLQDDIQDMFFTVAGMAWRSGMAIEAVTDFNLVCDSQMTKFDTSADEWAKTKAKFDELGIEVYFEVRRDPSNDVDYWITYSAKDQLDEKGRKCGKGKWLKSYKFVEPTLSDLPAEVTANLEGHSSLMGDYLTNLEAAIKSYWDEAEPALEADVKAVKVHFVKEWNSLVSKGSALIPTVENLFSQIASHLSK